MNGSASTGVLSLLMLSIMLMGTAAVSSELFMGNDDEENYGIDNYEEIIKDSLDEVSTYFNIKHILGKYYNDENKYYMGKAVILLKPYFDINFDLSGLHILLSNGERTLMLQKNDKTDLVGSHDVFEHPSWDYVSYGFYSILVVSDQDNSVKEFNVVNENTDMVYVTITLSDYFYVEKGDEIQVSLIPSCGNSQTFMLKAPLPTSTIVDLY